MIVNKFYFEELKKAKIPFIVWIVVISTFVAAAGEFPILGRQIAGWAWVIPLIISVLMILRKPSRITFPIRIWLPWVVIVVIYLIIFKFPYLQRNIMLLCPLIIGMAVSTSGIREIQLKGFLILVRLLLFALFTLVVIKTGLLFTGILPPITGLAAQSMIAALLCCIFAVTYSVNRKKDLLQWIIGAVIPIIALTRTAMIATGLTLPLTFASLKFKKRLIFFTIIGFVSLGLFFTERVQTKMFYSGSGTPDDMRLSNPDFYTGGRSRLWDLMIEEIKMRPLLGYGPNASEEFVLSITWGALTHPHNDWLRLLYDYGVLGTSLFVFCICAQVIHLLRRARRAIGHSRILIYAGATSFLPFVLFMYTDNIILYAAFFGNLQFTIFGLVYAALKTREIDDRYHFKMLSRYRPSNITPKENKFI
jgi:O-antigen ligase